MDLESLRIFVKVAELASFTRAAEHLGLRKSRVSLSLRALEAELGSHLLQRTTRTVRTTPDGNQFLERARRLVLEADELASMFQTSKALRGQVRVDLPVSFARDLVIPRLPEFLAAHPHLELLLSTTDRRVELVKEGFDCSLRVGTLPDSGLVARRLGVLPMMNVASASYVRKYGTPRTLDDLDQHLLVHYSLSLGADAPAFEYRDGDRYRERPMRALVTVNSVEAYHAACRAGLGIIQVPRSGLGGPLLDGSIVELLPELTCQPMPVTLVHGHGKAVPKRVRAVMAWIAEVMKPRLA